MRKCFICECDILVDKHGFPDGATFWKTTGNYGSRVYDPMRENLFLEALVCDKCIKKKRSLLEEVTVQWDYGETRQEPEFND